MIIGIDLFCGAGGLTLGLEAAGVKTICAVDFEPALRSGTLSMLT